MPEASVSTGRSQAVKVPADDLREPVEVEFLPADEWPESIACTVLDVVCGATYTSEEYLSSLQSAFDRLS